MWPALRTGSRAFSPFSGTSPSWLIQSRASKAIADHQWLFKDILPRSIGNIRHASTASDSDGSTKLQFCVVGSGPAGFYTVSQLLKTFGERVRVTIVDRLPSPFGLVRSGVAPDHPETKNVIHQFTELGKDPRVDFVGNVCVGTDVPLSTLREAYDGVILAYGAESNRVLNIPGRHLEGVFPAREFVWWYNGHPDYRHLPIDLSKVKRVAILGLGNVALDCARMILQPPQRLAATDTAPHALEQLKRSSIEQVDVIGRRGAAQAAFTAKELREVLRLEGIQVAVRQVDLALTGEDQAELKASRARRRVFELLKSAGDSGQTEGGKRLQLRFFRSPAEVLGDEHGSVNGLKLEKTELQQQNLVHSGEFETIEAQLILESIGYRSLPMTGAPFDEAAGIIPNRGGRVVTAPKGPAEPVPGLYVCGWVKRGPSGIIGTNLTDALETVNAIAEDVQLGMLTPRGREDAVSQVRQALQSEHVKAIDFQDWLRIDAAERQNGEAVGKERLKFTSVQEMLDVLS